MAQTKSYSARNNTGGTSQRSVGLFNVFVFMLTTIALGFVQQIGLLSALMGAAVVTYGLSKAFQMV